ncbi:unnamed protein product, partial [Mesorhabditis spiculigera]
MRDGSQPTATMTSRKKKRNQQTAVHPIQQVQPQPQSKPGSDVEDFICEQDQRDSDPDSDTLNVLVPDPEPSKDDRIRYPVLPSPTPSIPISSTPPQSIAQGPRNTSASPSPSIASLPALYEHRRESSSNLNRMGSPRQSSRDLSQYTKGIIVKPQAVPESDVVSSMVDFVQDVIPISAQANLPPSAQPEKIEWVDIQKVTKFGDPNKTLDLIIIGLARGFQLWTITESGICEEVLSERQGPLRVGKLLDSEPEPMEPDARDKFDGQRPLFALVDSSSSRSETLFCCLRFLSLGTANVVHKLTFDDPILEVESSSKWLVVAAGSRLTVCDQFTLQKRRSIEVATFDSQLPMAMRNSYLVWSDSQVRTDLVSIGGVAAPVEVTEASYTGQMLSAVKSISRTVTSVSSSSKKEEPLGVITVACLDCWYREDAKEDSHIKAHFIAQHGGISHIDMSQDGRLLVTADSTARDFNVFSLLLHSGTSSLGAAQHLYILTRGSTPAKVLSTTFSNDSRWLCISTNHGTVHAFALNPYGGPPTNRTHAGRLHNQQSKFTRSAGLSDADFSDDRHRSQSGQHYIMREHPAHRAAGSLGRASGNPRIGPFPPPLNRRLNAENLSAWASDLTHSTLGPHANTRRGKLALAFASRPVNDIKSTSVLVLSLDGILYEYGMRGSAGQEADAPIKIDIVPQASWTLFRTKNTPDVVTPLQPLSPLIRWTTYDATPTRVRSDSYRVDPNNEWNGQVEDTCTYSAPHRRLWQGPQFTFFSINETQPIQVSQAHGAGTQTIPIVIGDGGYGPHATRVEWCGSANGDRTGEKERDEIAKRIAEAMGEERSIDHDKEEKSSIDDVFFDSSDHSAPARVAANEELMSFDDL